MRLLWQSVRASVRNPCQSCPSPSLRRQRTDAPRRLALGDGGATHRTGCAGPCRPREVAGIGGARNGPLSVATDHGQRTCRLPPHPRPLSRKGERGGRSGEGWKEKNALSLTLSQGAKGSEKGKSALTLTLSQGARGGKERPHPDPLPRGEGSKQAGPPGSHNPTWSPVVAQPRAEFTCPAACQFREGQSGRVPPPRHRTVEPAGRNVGGPIGAGKCIRHTPCAACPTAHGVCRIHWRAHCAIAGEA
jgi:hypothetical protein